MPQGEEIWMKSNEKHWRNEGKWDKGIKRAQGSAWNRGHACDLTLYN